MRATGSQPTAVHTVCTCAREYLIFYLSAKRKVGHIHYLKGLLRKTVICDIITNITDIKLTLVNSADGLIRLIAFFFIQKKEAKTNAAYIHGTELEEVKKF